MKYSSYFFILLIVLISGCQNRVLNEGEEFKPKEIHENIKFHFDKIEVDGIEYLILERDNNNPHEGFGFMAFRANLLMEKQDSILAYLRTIMEMQTMIYARTHSVSMQTATQLTEETFQKHLYEEQAELTELEKQELSGETNSQFVEKDSLKR